MSDAFYDVIVVGTELAGLVAAAMLAKRNYRVLVLGHGPSPSEFHIDGIRYSRRPSLFSGFETSGLIKRAFAELALSVEMQNRPKVFEPYYQVVMPGRRIDLSSKEAILQREFEREFPGDLERIQQFYRIVRDGNAKLSKLLDEVPVLPPDGFFEGRAWRKLLAASLEPGIADPLSIFPEGHPFRAFALAPLAFSSGCQMTPHSVVQLVRLQSHLGRGLYDIEGGVDKLKRIFIDKVKSNCGDFRDRATIEKLVTKRGKVREVILKDRREVLGCEAVICNMDLKRFFSLIPQEDQNERFHLKMLELQPVSAIYTTNFAVKADAIPVGMANHVFQIESVKRPLEGENAVLISVDPSGPQDDPSIRVIAVSTRLPARSLRLTPENVVAMDERLAQCVKNVIPFFDEHLVARAPGCLSIDRRTGEPSVDATLLAPVYASALEDTLDTTPVAARTAYKNVFVAGDQLYTGLGFEGSFYGSLNVLKLTTELVTRKTLLN
ncbi:MAG: NAD(P)/FAD-dependent oxidoreductase [Myxococcales bacterium]|nr:NAD(P)/FAD-dependent oxidoreductase [Myxococcales bacterium]